MNNIVLAFTISLFLFSCDSGKKGSFTTKVYNSNVASSLINSDKELSATRTELSFVSGSKVNNCVEYIKNIANSKINEGVNNQLIKSEYLICDVLSLLENKRYSIVKANNELVGLLATKLDLRSFPSSFGPRLDEKKYTLKSLAGNKLIINEGHVIYDTEEWQYRIELIAVSDINNNKKDDWMLWFSDESKSGNYRGYQTLVLYDVDTSKNILVDKHY